MSSPVQHVPFPPFCGEEFPFERQGFIGTPIVCTKECHPPSEMHVNAETGTAWWERDG